MAHEHIVYMMLCDSAARQRDRTALGQFTPRARELAERDGHRPYLAIVQRAWGVARRLDGDYNGAADEFGQALAAFEQRGMRWQMGRTLIELGELEAERQAPGRARAYFEQALAQFHALRAQPAADEARSALVELQGPGGD